MASHVDPQINTVRIYKTVLLISATFHLIKYNVNLPRHLNTKQIQLNEYLTYTDKDDDLA
jgi:hypothetical protein